MVSERENCNGLIGGNGSSSGANEVRECCRVESNCFVGVVCMWHGWFGLSATACWGRMSDRGSGRKRVGMACMELSCKRVNHSGTLRGTEDVECCIPPCSSKRRRN